MPDLTVSSAAQPWFVLMKVPRECAVDDIPSNRLGSQLGSKLGSQLGNQHHRRERKCPVQRCERSSHLAMLSFLFTRAADELLKEEHRLSERDQRAKPENHDSIDSCYR